MDRLHIVAFTHRNLPLNAIGTLHISPENQPERLSELKASMQLDELLFLSTCNRVEFMFISSKTVDYQFLIDFFNTLYPDLTNDERQLFSDNAFIQIGMNAVSHMLSVASSVDSMVVGEREIITQVRTAYDACKSMGICGDLIRIVIKHTIHTAKRVYTETSIACKPVSVVSLAYHKLRDLNIPLDARILIVGAGVTNTNMSRFLKKHGFKRFHVFNRTLAKAELLANDLHGTAHPLTELSSFNQGFDVIITCTGSENHLITPEIYEQLLQNETERKVVIDLAIPQDLSPLIVEKHKVTHISIEVLQKISDENLRSRAQEIQHVEEILKEALYEFDQIHQLRNIEIAMREVPNKVKEIKSNAMDVIFKDDVKNMDESSREILEKIVQYMEKKYMSVPMLMAKEILMKSNSK